MSLRTSLTLAYSGMLAFLMTALAVGYHSLLVNELDAQSTAVLDDVTRGLHGYLQFRDGSPVLEYSRADPEAVTFVEEATRYYQVYDANSGRLLVQSAALESLGLHYTPAEVTAFRHDLRIQDVETDGGRLRIQSSVIAPTSSEAYLLQVGEPLERVDRTIAGFERLLVWFIAAGLLTAVGGGHWMAGRALTPLSRLAKATRDISINNLGHRLPVRGGRDELDEVAHAFNQALERLERAVGEMRQFSAALAHELRTPLAILRGETELALQQSLSPAELRQRLAMQLDAFDELARLISQILTLARAEAGEIPLLKEPVDLAALSSSVVEQMEAVADAKQVALTSDGAPRLDVLGDPGWLERLLLILLDNAIKFTAEGGRITVHVSREERTARLDVRDTGRGIPASAIPHVFERFYRADPARSRHTEGAGLGLTLAKWIANHHGGTIEVVSREGEGSTFTVRIPLAE